MRSAKPSALIVVLGLIAAWPAPAAARGARPSLTTAQAPGWAEPIGNGQLVRERPEQWQASYAEAKSVMLAGRFAEAAARFQSLILSASDPADRMLASEMASACQVWARGGFALATPQSMAMASAAVLQDRRSTDEIAMLYTNAVLYGLYAGATIDVLDKPSSAAGMILPPLMLAGASAGAIAVLDKAAHLGYGVPQSIVSGMYIGFEEGIAWTLWHEASVNHSSEWGSTVFPLILGTGTLGAIAGGVVGTAYGTTPGRASLMGSFAMWSGLFAGTFMGGVFESDDVGMLSSAVALNIGAVAGVIAGAKTSPSIGRVRFIDLGGLGGALVVGGLYLAMEDKNSTARGALLSTSLGMAAGLVTAWLLTRDLEKDLPRKNRQPSFAERLLPTVAPSADGKGVMLGVGSTI